MKLADALQKYRSNGYILNEQRTAVKKKQEEMQKRFEETGAQEFSDAAATLQLSMDSINKAYEENRKVLENLSMQHMTQWNAEVSEQQADAAKKDGEDRAKIMTVFRRMAHGDSVPGSDERKLMEFDMEMYKVAKNMQALARQLEKEHKKYKSLWDDEEDPKEYDPEGRADNAQAQGPLPSIDIPSGEEIGASLDIEV